MRREPLRPLKPAIFGGFLAISIGDSPMRLFRKPFFGPSGKPAKPKRPSVLPSALSIAHNGGPLHMMPDTVRPFVITAEHKGIPPLSEPFMAWKLGHLTDDEIEAYVIRTIGPQPSTIGEPLAEWMQQRETILESLAQAIDNKEVTSTEYKDFFPVDD